MQSLGGLPRGVADKKVARQCTRVRLLVNLRRGRDKENSGLLVLEVIRSRLAEVGNDVVNHGTVGGANFEHLHPFVFLETRGNNHILIVHHSRRRNRKRLGQLKHNVWRRDAPTLHKTLRRRWHIFRGAFLRASVHPGNQGPNFIRGQRTFVGVMSVLGVGKPRRHNFFCDHQPDRGGPRAGFFITEHREGGGLARPMAGLAVLLQNRRYVLGKRRRRIVRFLCTRAARGTKRKQKQSRETCDSASCYFHFSSPSTSAT